MVGEPDLFGNPTSTEAHNVIKVAGYSVPQSTEPKVAGHDRLTVVLEMFAPVGAFSADDVVEVPGYGRLSVAGVPENYEHGPFDWAPGCEVVNLVRDDRENR